MLYIAFTSIAIVAGILNFIKALDKHVAETMKKAEDRCKANGRATIRPCDL